jgi:hypothetical protein
LILLFALRKRAQGVSLVRTGEHVEFCFQHVDGTEKLIAPPAFLVDELAEELRRLASLRERASDWWDRRRSCEVLAEREGAARLLLGGLTSRLHYRVLPYSGGMLVELTLIPDQA